MVSNFRRFFYFFLTVFLFSSFLFSTALFASEDENLEFKFSNERYKNTLPAKEVYSRTQAVLKYYDSPTLSKGQEELSPLNGIQSNSNLKNILKYFDMNNMFNRLFKVTPTELQGFDDLDGKSNLNFKISLEPTRKRYRLNLDSTTELPLKGLRVAIDPGHMGEPFWDELTGKFVKDGKGNSISEGLINLQTSLLLERELKALGAQVLLTRTELGPVTDMAYKDLPIPEFARRELLEQVYSPWFLKLLSIGSGKPLLDAFDKNSDRKKLWSQSSRSRYFIIKEDLWARANRINSFNPDIVLIIHYDALPNATDDHIINEKSPNRTTVFVSGAYYDTEFGSRIARTQFAKKLLDQTQWEESVLLGKQIISEFKTQMDIDAAKSSESSIFVAPGVFSRNLNLLRFLNAPAVAYLECLYYSRPEEFYAFKEAKHPLIINGINHPYSDRLMEVVQSIKQGVLNYSGLKK